MTTETTAAAPAPRPGSEVLNGKVYMRDAKGALMPIEGVKAMDLLIDETARKIAGYAETLAGQVARFKAHSLDDVAGLKALIAQEYGLTIGGKRKGNLSIMSYDGLTKVSLKIADLVVYGPELQAAKELVDQCLLDWAQGSSPQLRAVVMRAFNVDAEGRVNRADLAYLLRMENEDPRWQEAMRAIRDAERPVGTKEYLQVHVREDVTKAWRHVAIDLAAA